MERTRVIIADDESLIRMDLREMLTNLGYLVAGEVGDGRSAVNLAREVRPDIVIMDIKMPDMDGIEAAQGVPAPVAELKDRIADADALLLVTPEYNNSVPGPLKNAIDWLSRPGSDIARVFGDKPTGLIGASPGPGGTRLAQVAWLPVLRLLGTRPWFGKSVYVADAGKAFDAEGALVDERLRGVLAAYLQGFAAFAAAG